MFRRLALSLLVLGIAAPALAAEPAPKTLRVYFVGNSVTDTINYTWPWLNLPRAEATRKSGVGT